MKKCRRHVHSWPWLLLGILIILALSCPSLVWAQADQRVPVELKLKIDNNKIGQTFVTELKKWISRSDKFVLNSSETPRLVLHINAQDIAELPYQAVVTVIWTLAAPGKGAPREIFQNYLVMVGMSQAHSGKDAQDILDYTRQNILPAFTALKGEKK